MQDYEFTDYEIEDVIYSDILSKEEEIALHEAEECYWNSRCREEFSDRVLSGDWA